MTLLGRLGLSPESAALEGEPDEVDARVRAAHAEKLRPARIRQHAASGDGLRLRLRLRTTSSNV